MDHFKDSKYDPVLKTLSPVLFLHIILDQELALHSKPRNSDILMMIAAIIILTHKEYPPSMATAFIFFNLFFRLYLWLEGEFQQVMLGQGLQNDLTEQVT